MKRIFLGILLISIPALGAGKQCVCTCVVKEGDTVSTMKGKGVNRETAGESLKKALGKKKCEISPSCEGAGCKLDD